MTNVRYRNLRTGREYERPVADEWLEASSGWERVTDAPDPEPEAEPAAPADDTPGTGDDDSERTD